MWVAACRNKAGGLLISRRRYAGPLALSGAAGPVARSRGSVEQREFVYQPGDTAIRI
jgi:hypothetical protein